ncbi:MAG: mechanosensitive ion channel family protein, partial [Clostridia bacterium]|nr:mechanosensitive ion channel family protein [Clostridia bacterium]
MFEQLSMANLFTRDYHSVSVLMEQIGVALGIFLVFLFLQRFLAKKIIQILAKLTQKTSTAFDDQLIQAFERPLQLFFVVLGAYLALNYLPLNQGYNLLVLKLFRSAVVILITYGFYNLAGYY